MPRRLTGGAEQAIDVPAEACFAVLADVGGWPAWFDRVRRVEVLERDAGGVPARVRVLASVLRFDLEFLARVRVEAPTRVELERVPFGPGDDETLHLTVTVEPVGAGCAARARIEAEVDVPRLVPLPGAVGDRFTADLLRALAAASSSRAG